MTVAELKPDTLTERANARQALADAIAGVDNAVARLEEAKAAVEAGWSRMIDAGNRVEALKAELPRLSSAPPADAVMASLTAGGAVLEVERSPRAVAESEIAALEGSREQLRRAIETAEREVENRKRAVEHARLRAHRAAVEVLKTSGAAARLLEGLADLQEQVVRRRVALRFLATFKAIPQSEQAAVDALLSGDRELPGLPGYGNWRNHPTHAAYYDALALLERDADARLPV
jgi:DNA repair exonuclease SbcCD ATPase subunit